MPDKKSENKIFRESSGHVCHSCVMLGIGAVPDIPDVPDNSGASGNSDPEAVPEIPENDILCDYSDVLAAAIESIKSRSENPGKCSDCERKIKVPENGSVVNAGVIDLEAIGEAQEDAPEKEKISQKITENIRNKRGDGAPSIMIAFMFIFIFAIGAAIIAFAHTANTIREVKDITEIQLDGFEAVTALDAQKKSFLQGHGEKAFYLSLSKDDADEVPISSMNLRGTVNVPKLYEMLITALQIDEVLEDGTWVRYRKDKNGNANGIQYTISNPRISFSKPEARDINMTIRCKIGMPFRCLTIVRGLDQPSVFCNLTIVAPSEWENVDIKVEN